MANRPRQSLLNLFDPLNSAGQALPSTPERKENIYSSPKTAIKTGGQRDFASETVFFKRTYSRRGHVSTDKGDGAEDRDGCLVSFVVDVDEDEEEDDEHEPQEFTQQRQPLLDLTPSQVRVNRDTPQLEHTALLPNDILPTSVSQPLTTLPTSLDELNEAVLPQTPSKTHMAEPSSCESSPCDSASGSPTVRLPLSQVAVDDGGRPASPTPSQSQINVEDQLPRPDLLSMSVNSTSQYLSTPAEAETSSPLPEQIEEANETTSKESADTTLGEPLQLSDEPSVAPASQQAEPSVIRRDFASSFGPVFSAPPKPQPKRAPPSPPMLTDRPIPILAKPKPKPQPYQPLVKTKPRRQDRSVDMHASILLNTSDVEASVDLLNDDMSFLANMSDRSVDAAGVGNASVMAGFGRKGCSDVYKGFTRKVTEVDAQSEGMQGRDESEVVVGRTESKESSKAPAGRRVADLEELVPYHARAALGQRKPKAQPYQIQLPPSPPPHEIALPPSPPPLCASRSVKSKEESTSKVEPSKVYLPPSPPPAHLHRSKPVEEYHSKTSSTSSLKSSTGDAQPHQIHLPPSPPPTFTEMPSVAKEATNSKPDVGRARRMSRMFTAPPSAFTASQANSAASAAPVPDKQSISRIAPRRSSLAMPTKIVPTLAPIRPLMVTKKSSRMIQPVTTETSAEKAPEATKPTAAGAAPLARSRSRASLLVTKPTVSRVTNAETAANQPSKVTTSATARSIGRRTSGMLPPSAPPASAPSDQAPIQSRLSIRDRLRNGAGGNARPTATMLAQQMAANNGNVLASSTSSNESSASGSGSGTASRIGSISSGVNASTLLRSGVQRPPRGGFGTTSASAIGSSISAAGVPARIASTRATGIPATATASTTGAFETGASTRLRMPASRIATSSTSRLPAPGTAAGGARRFGKY